MATPVQHSGFRFTPTDRLHPRRVQRIRDLAATALAPAAEHAFAYATAHHYLEGADAAARAGDHDLFAWYTAHPDAGAHALATPTAVGNCVVIAPEQLITSPISDTPYYLLNPYTRPAPGGDQELARAAYAVADDTGFGDLLAGHARILAFLGHKQYNDTFDSWTISRLPGTVFVDHVADPAALARDLIHEAGHNWLNDALVATGCKLDDQALFHSPWKRTLRPAYGFLHACWAFPLTMIYTARVLDRTDGASRRFLTSYLDLQRTFLADTGPDHARALALIPDEDLREHLHVVHQQAIQL
ncbi:aKG-HExxH-type peptide beta-hydroxylase [Kitasatospora sp. NPDC058190]|uniref:aKG-HExxH-type peptide beta-hydroxylase n=1 Tax=Kitasatospora sp. NPDC058190 TaxID=3346371 RepID=UPI0036DB4E9A